MKMSALKSVTAGRRALIVAVGLISCGPGRGGGATEGQPKTPVKESGDAAYDPSRVLDVDITMPAQQWTALRTKGRDASSLATECREPVAKIYPYYAAEVGIDGTALSGVEVRKKGFLGSLSVLRPSLKVRLAAKKPKQRFRGVKRLTLNNNKQDVALMRTCLTYQVFRAAKLPAPLCNFARVRVNGTDLGIYTNVEPIKKPFLRRNFGDDSGTLFEGQIADFDDAHLGNFEQKTKTGDNDRAALRELATILAKPGGNVASAVAPYIDVDEFVTFWAVETLTGHWDGYSGNRNNFYLYRSPKDAKFHFIPWGPDLSFTNADPFHSPTRPATVSATGRLAARLYADPAVRAAYIKRLSELLATVWNEKALVAEVDRIDALLEGAPDDKGVAQIKTFIMGRAKHMSTELAVGGAEWKEKARSDPCLLEGAALSGSFETVFGSIAAPNPLVAGKANLSLVLDGKTIEMKPLGVVAGRDEQSGGVPVVRFVGMSGGNIYGVQLFFEEQLFRSGETQPLQGFATWGMVFELENMANFKIWGFFGKGDITLEQASMTADAPVKGSFRATLYEIPEDAR